MQIRRLGQTDLDVSILGFGASPLGGEFGPIDEAEGERAVHAAVDRGVNYFDTSPYYGRTLSEQRLGRALAGRRQKVIVSTKCGRYDVDGFDFSAARVERSIGESLQRLKTDNVDLYIVHDIEYGDRRQVIEEAIPAARRVQQAGKARWVGISGLQLDLLREVAEAAQIDVILSYARYNLAVRDLDDRLRPFVEQRGLGLINASPLLLGALSNGEPPAWHPAPPELLGAARKAAAACREEGADLAQIALRFAVEYPHAASTLVGMSTVAQLEANVAGLETPLDILLLKKVESLLTPFRRTIWPTGREENWDPNAKRDY